MIPNRETPLFKTPEERSQWKASAVESPTDILPGTCWRIPLHAGIYADLSKVKRDTAMVLLFELEGQYLLQKKEMPTPRLSREQICESSIFCQYVRLLRQEADVKFQSMLQPGSEDLQKYQESHPDGDSTKLLQNIEAEARQIAEDNLEEWEDDIQFLSPQDAATLEEEILGETVIVTYIKDKDGRDSNMPLIGPKTKGEVTDVTERGIYVDLDDGREFHLCHGVDKYERFNSKK